MSEEREKVRSLAAQVRFLKHTLRFPCYGDPEAYPTWRSND